MSTATRSFRFVEPSALPGFGLALGLTMLYLSFFLLIPLAALALRPWEHGLGHVWHVVSAKRTLDALSLSFGAALFGACVNAVFGTIVAWVLVRYDFPGKRLLDAFVDLPFALPTAVAGISLATIYAPNGMIGALFEPYGIHIAYTRTGIIIALIFVGFPFVVRAIQPVLEDLQVDVEEAAATLGANRFRTIVEVIFPAILPALMTGFSLALARAVGEYGSVIFISSNLQNVSEITPLLIIHHLEDYDYSGAAAIGLEMLLISLIMILTLNIVQGLISRKGER